ncbi:unnamed protein product [Protopolystoma xenopodis]|uniref:Uncharacterized protein n=1 Tax=Protopolystoma xenopodis TaxID=117903 RepID=A0A448WBB2_9PLAT|nr:unnamed protein product [Protopolystoma xenopodis]
MLHALRDVDKLIVEKIHYSIIEITGRCVDSFTPISLAISLNSCNIWRSTTHWHCVLRELSETSHHIEPIRAWDYKYSRFFLTRSYPRLTGTCPVTRLVNCRYPVVELF